MKIRSTNQEKKEFRVLAREKADEVTADEIAQISGGVSGTLNCHYGNGTGDHLKADGDLK